MTFDISAVYFNKLRKLQQIGWVYFVIMFVISLVGSVSIFNKHFENSPVYCLTAIVVGILVLGYIYYSRVATFVREISNTISAVEILEDALVFRTSEFKVPFFKATTKDVTISPHEARTREVNYRLKFIYDLNKPVWKITKETQEFYLLFDFFEANLYPEITKLF